MEKPGRSTSASSKGPNSESKGKQEANNNSNKHSRTPKHKENVCPRPEQTRRPTPQRNRVAYDKRPRSRGGYGTDRDRSEVTQANKFGTDSAVKLGNKKLSLNHLLNFTLTPSPGSLSNEYHGGGWQGGRNHRKQKLPKYNKEQFLQANCQFVVKEEGDYTVHTTDPDILVNWDLVEEIHLPSHQVPSCPICLYPPTAAKITRCGHIYCWSCLLHYLSLSDKSWRKCPICYESIHKTDLKSVVSTSKAAYSVGDEVTMCLMKRKRGSVIAKPVYQTGSFHSSGPLSLSDDANCFQKLLIATKDRVKCIIQREYDELKHQLEEEADTPESCFLESALELLQEREQLLLQGQIIDKAVNDILTINDNSVHHENNSFTQTKESLICSDSYCQVEHMTDPFSDDEDHEITLSSLPDHSNNIADSLAFKSTSDTDLETPYADATTNEMESSPDVLQLPPCMIENPSTQRTTKQQGNEHYYYFYQAIDGQNIYLHALNVQMLKMEFGSLEQSPLTFTAKILELDGVSMNEALRQRFSYLRHLPLTCEFQIAELDICSPLIHNSTREAFSGEVHKRRQTRRRKAQEEKRREKHIQQEENRKLGKFPGLSCHLDSLQHFPACSQPIDISDPPLLSDPFTTNSSSSMQSPTGLSSSPDQATEKLPNDQTDIQVVQPASFAQMLREGKTKQPLHLSPDNKSIAGSPSSDDDCDAPVPLFRQSLGDAIEAALHNMNQLNVADNPENQSKKKKGKKTLLFSTSFNRRK